MRTIVTPLEDFSNSSYAFSKLSENSLFFDIETTGFSPINSCLYLIGCAYKEKQKFYIRQWFAESPGEEGEVLVAFLEFVKDYQTLISFNGLGFDIPFMKGKCKQFDVTDSFDSYDYVDLYKIATSFKNLFGLANYKQKTIEQFLNISRLDIYDGGQLIEFYKRYAVFKETELEPVLLLHNAEDVEYMLAIYQLLSYKQLLKDDYEINDIRICNAEADFSKLYLCEQALLITVQLQEPLPTGLHRFWKSFSLNLKKELLVITLPIYEGELKYFYPDYKNYYYLPKEDMAIHKSVGSYVDKGFRENAKASNCYTRKKSQYIPQFEDIFEPFFLTDYRNKLHYIECNHLLEASLLDKKHYVQSLLQYALKEKAIKYD